MSRGCLTSLSIAAAVMVAASPARAATFELAIDVPARLGATDFTPDQLVRQSEGSYTLMAQLPAGTTIGALHRNGDGAWLLTPERPTDLGGSIYDARDIVRWDGIAYSPYLDGSAVGIPDGSRIDALTLDESGRPIVSFDVPTTIGAELFLPGDLVLDDAGAFTVYWSAAAAGLPAGANLVGVARTPAGRLIVTFDVPTRLGGIDYLPGQLIEWLSGATFALHSSDPSWPASTQLRDFSLVPASGGVPDGSADPAAALFVTRSGNQLELDWSPSCAGGDTDYAVYEGALGSFTTHVPRLCSTGGATAAALTPAGGDTYYLAVPRNALSEGSYGFSSAGLERLASVSACLPQTVGACASQLAP